MELDLTGIASKRYSFQKSMDELLQSCQQLIDAPIPEYCCLSSLSASTSAGALLSNELKVGVNLRLLCDSIVYDSFLDAFDYLKSIATKCSSSRNSLSSLNSCRCFH